MKTKIIAWLMSTFAFALPLIYGQPAKAPETRTSPYVEGVPDQYGVWPTTEFETAKAPWWLQTWALRPTLSLYGALQGGSVNEGIIALHKGKIVYEWYGDGYDQNNTKWLASATKSVVSALVGIAIGDSFIKSVDDKVVDYFPDAEIEIAPDLKKGITIQQLLTMTSGLAGDDEYADFADLYERNLSEAEWDVLRVRMKDDTAKAILELWSMTAKPGERWNYCSDGVHLLLGVVGRAIDRPLQEYVDEKLFGPMGITNYGWDRVGYRGNPFYGGSGLYLTPRDMAKFGYLYLNYGRWDDKQLIPADWVAQSAPVSKSPFGYGRLFWNVKFAPLGNAYEANGAQGQYIMIFPSQDLVIVRTGQSPRYANNTHLSIEYTGVAQTEQGEAIIQANGLPCGSVYITYIYAESSLRGTDARVNDIITHVNDEPLDVPDVLFKAMESGKVGDVIKLTIVRVNSAGQSIETFEVNAELTRG